MKTLLRFRIPIIVGLLLLTGLLGGNINKMTRDASVGSMLPKNNPDYVYSQEMEDLFGSVDQFVIGFTFPDTVYTVPHLTLIQELTEYLENLEGLDEDDVKSVTNVKDMEGRDGELLVERMLDEDTEVTAEAIRTIREKVRSNPMFRGKLVSTDERSAVVLAGVPAEIAESDERAGVLLAQIQQKCEELKQNNPDVALYISGKPVILVTKSEYMKKDLRLLFPIAVVVVVIMLFLLLRRLSGVIVPVLVTLFSIVWTFGLKGLIGSPLTMAETTIPVMLIAIGCADGVHIISEFFEYRKRGIPVKDAITMTMRVLTMPVIMTSVTTGLGFASLISAPGVSLKNMGIFLTFGVLAAMLFSLLFIPAVLSFMRNTPSKKEFSKTNGHQRGFAHFMTRAGNLVIRGRIVIVTLAIVFLLISVLAIIHIGVEASDLYYLKKDNPLRMATEHIQDTLGGIFSLDIILEGSESDVMKQPRVLKAMQELQQFCEEQELVSYTLSVGDMITRMNYVLHDQNPEYDRIPNDIEIVEGEEIPGASQVAQFFLLYEMDGGDDLNKTVDSQYQITRITVRLKETSTKKLGELLQVIRLYVKDHFPKEVTVKYANFYKSYVMMTLIIESQINSLIIALITILFLLAIIFRSPLAGILTAIPVFIAVLFNFAIMWMFGITLNIGTACIASIGMGVGIDYAIHYFSRFKLLFRETQNYHHAIVLALKKTGQPILTNAAAVGTGFLVLLLSEYHIIASLGWITALSMATTALSSLIVLPALIAIFKPNVKIRAVSESEQRQRTEKFVQSEQ